MEYRREIDGLRSIAILPVIFFHAGFEIFSGGYVGVDIFFVISGYLITTLIISDLRNDHFSFSGFYERRIRRLFPALFFVIFITTIISTFVLRPDLYKDFSQSLVAVTTFSSNMLFFHETGYFAAAAEEKPLLHTWSLAVEEQFYIIFPILLLLIQRINFKYTITLLISLFILSFTGGLIFSKYSASLTFFISPFRFWELLTGAILAFSLTQYPNLAKGNGFVALFGLILISISIFLFTEHTPFPSLYSLIPIFGTAMIIVGARKTNWAGRLLASPGPVFFGLISYSLYLWHQPLFAFARILSLNEPDSTTMALLCLCSVILAWLTWKYIEKPFRKKNYAKTAQWRVFTPAILVSLLIAGIGLAGHLSNGLKQRFPDTMQTALKVAQDPGLSQYSCRNGNSQNIPVCQIGSTNDFKKSVLLIGNSHLRMFLPQLNEEFQARKIKGIHSRFSFEANDLALHNMSGTKLTAWKTDIKSLAKEASHIIVSMRWTQELTAQANYLKQTPVPHTLTQQKNIASIISDRLQFLKSLGKPLIIIGPVPEAPFDVPKHMILSKWLNLSLASGESELADHLAANKHAISLLEAISQNDEQVKVLDALSILCPHNTCQVYSDNLPLYYDDNHLTQTGTALITRKLLALVD